MNNNAENTIKKLLKILQVETPCPIALKENNDTDGLIINYDGNAVNIEYGHNYPFCRAALIVANKGFDKNYTYTERRTIKNLGVMIDCSRNAVPNIKTLKRFIDLIVMVGYNELLLYMEDTYEIEGEPLFGYLRGRYSKSELKEIIDYCNGYGVVLTPCIQTLAHIRQVKRWPRFSGLFDVDDVLLIGEKEVYDLIDKMFFSLTDGTGIKKIHIGMDEAYLVGLGRYLQINGYKDRFEILIEHLKKVSEIAKKYSVTVEIWGDMLMRLLNDGTIYSDSGVITLDEKFKTILPENVELVYWDYYSDDTSRYDVMIKTYKQFSNELCFAGGLWKWKGFAPDNSYSMRITKAAIPAIIKNGVNNVMFTCWGDDGAESSLFSILPSLVFGALKLSDLPNEEIESEFNTLTGYSFKDFMVVDDLDALFSEIKERGPINPSKYFLYNDLFLGCFDVFAKKSKKSELRDFIKRTRNVSDGEFGYIFKTEAALAEVLLLKYDMGNRIRKSYKGKNKKAISEIISDLSKLLDSIKSFYSEFRSQWNLENKPYGFEVQDIRLGGLIKRVEHCQAVLNDYVCGKVTVIPELEEELIGDVFGNFTVDNYYMVEDWNKTVSPNVL